MSEDEESPPNLLNTSLTVRDEGGAFLSPLPGPWAPGELPTVHREWLETRPRHIRGVLKSRVGRGGQFQYLPWTSTADVFDAVFGPGGWQVNIHHLNQEERVYTDKDNLVKSKIEVTTWCKFRAVGLPFPEYDVMGHGFYYYMADPESSLADAIESAMSRCITKMGARLSKYLRAVWAKDNEVIKSMTPATQGDISAVHMMYDEVVKLKGGKAKTVKLFEKYGLASSSEVTVENLTSTEAQELTKALAAMMVDGADDAVVETGEA